MSVIFCACERSGFSDWHQITEMMERYQEKTPPTGAPVSRRGHEARLRLAPCLGGTLSQERDKLSIDKVADSENGGQTTIHISVQVVRIATQVQLYF